LEKGKSKFKGFLSMQLTCKNRYSYNTKFFFYRIHHLFVQKAKDPLERAVLDGCQLALKVCYVSFYFLEKISASNSLYNDTIQWLMLQISANSVHGFTGATVGQKSCLEIIKHDQLW
jgi:hypothetical protein